MLLLVALLPQCAFSLRIDALSTRRSVIAAAPALVLGPLAAHAVKETGYAANRVTAENSGAGRRLADAPFGDPAGVRLGGTYSDAAHPGCVRRILLSGSTAIITGADEDGKPWKVKGQVQGRSILVDFTAKGGPKDVVATWTGLGLRFPDGNLWTKK